MKALRLLESNSFYLILVSTVIWGCSYFQKETYCHNITLSFVNNELSICVPQHIKFIQLDTVLDWGAKNVVYIFKDTTVNLFVGVSLNLKTNYKSPIDSSLQRQFNLDNSMIKNVKWLKKSQEKINGKFFFVLEKYYELSPSGDVVYKFEASCNENGIINYGYQILGKKYQKSWSDEANRILGSVVIK